jgi:hypothetical protein
MPDGQMWGDFNPDGHFTGVLTRNRDQNRHQVPHCVAMGIFQPNERLSTGNTTWETITIPRAKAAPGCMIDVFATARVVAVSGSADIRIHSGSVTSYFTFASATVANRIMFVRTTIMYDGQRLFGCDRDRENSAENVFLSVPTPGDISLSITSSMGAGNTHEFLSYRAMMTAL